MFGHFSRVDVSAKDTHRQGLLAAGFTIIELVISLLVMIVLATVVIDSVVQIGVYSRDNQRQEDIETISQALERYYKTNAVAAGPTYPPTSVGKAGIAAIVGSSASDALVAPNDTSSNSVIMASTAASQFPNSSQYIYQPLTSGNAICTAAPCVRYILYYSLESTNSIVAQASMRQQ